ncbi:TaqI-like C-terminal specificity domain-containing protein, partial [Flavobacterium filum]|uniref:TaqI-like C-terminal specificity domain-containing protein n=1 Tax=Flavobacterium filum TaxID=370974 RepID=UPI003211F424
MAYITPNRFLSASYGKAFREILLTNYELISLIDYSDKNVFADASTYPVITFIRNQLPLKTYNLITGKFDDLTKKLISNKYPSDKLNILDDFILGFLLNDKINLTIKVFSQSEPLENCGKINATSTASEADLYSSLITDENGYKLINTGTIDPYISLWGIDFLTDKGTKYLRPYLPKTSNIISTNRHNLYSTQKIIISKIGLKCEAFFDKKSEYASINTNCIYNFSDLFLPEYITCWLNSKLFNYTFECLFDGLRMSGGYLLFSAPNLKNTRIKKISLLHQNPFVAKADQMLSLNKDLLEKSIKFQRTLQRKFEGIEVNKKLESWYELTFAEFVKELGKKKIKLSLSEESEWEDYFLQEQQKAVAIKNEIDATDKEIDRMVYELYGLTEE